MSQVKVYRRTVLSLAIVAVASLALPLASQATKTAPAAKPPAATTTAAQQVSYSSATLTATVNPHGSETSYYFQYGPTTAYGAQTTPAAVGNGTQGVRLSQALAGLQLGTLYHFRVVAVSAAGTTLGQDRFFTTRTIPLKFDVSTASRLDSFGSPLLVTGTLTGTGAANHEVILQGDPYPYIGAFSDIGSPATTNADGSFAFQLTGLTQNTQLRVTTPDTLPAYSPVFSVRVAVHVTLHARSTGRPGYVHLYGTVTPAEVGSPVTFQLLRSNRGALTVGATVVRNGTTSAARFSSVVFIRHGRGGSYRAYVNVTNGRHAPGYSRSVLVHSAPAGVRGGRR